MVSSALYVLKSYSVLIVKYVQHGPGVVTLEFKDVFGGLGDAVLLQTVTPVEPLLQRVVHALYFSSRPLMFIGKILLLSENIMVRH